VDEKQKMWLWIGLFLLITGLISSVLQGRVPEGSRSQKGVKIKRLILDDKTKPGIQDVITKESAPIRDEREKQDISYFQ